MQRQLIITAGPDTGRIFTLVEGQTVVIGRGQASDTQINDPRISRIHCHVQVVGGRAYVIDAGSATGTAVNGQPVNKQELKPGDLIQVGDTAIRYQLPGNLEQSTLIDRPFGHPRPQPAVAPLQTLVGQSLAHYQLNSIIAGGHSGVVFKATDTQKDRVAAVKVLSPDLTSSDEQRERFVRAMKTMMPIHHPHLVPLYNAGKNGPYCWCAMEFIEGENLAQVILRLGVDNMLDWREVWRVAVHIGRALQKAYEEKIVHRNLSPTNILRRTKDKWCLLGDLMLAKALEGTLARPLTQPGQLIGDVAYMAPERTEDGATVDGRSDMYGLGATLYALLAGHAPFHSKSLPELIRMIREDDPLEPKTFQLAINDQFQDSILRMIAKEPSARYQTPADLLRDLERIGTYANLKFE